MQEYSFQVFEAFTAATIIYMLVNLVVVLADARASSAGRGSGPHRHRRRAAPAGH